MEISSKSSNGCPWQAFISTLLEDWREEIIPERDGLLGETTGDNVRHVIVRAEFLDRFFGDPKIKAAIKDWVQRTPLKRQVQQMSRAVKQFGDIAGISWNQIGWDEDTCVLVSPGTDAGATQKVEGANALVRSFLLELRRFSESSILGTVVGEAVHLLENLDLGYQWLTIELLQVYFANLFIDDLSWQYTDKLNSETPDIPAEEMTFEFSTREGESLREAISRFRNDVELAIGELERYQQPLSRGSLPGSTRSSLRRNAKWFYLQRVAGRSIRSIAQEEFPGEADRRKDVRDGIKSVRELLDLGRRDSPYAYNPDRPVWRPA